VIEESPEGFIQRWREYAAEVQVFPRTEGSPMLECLAAGAILQVLDRTGPYQGGSGRRRVIINPMVETLEPLPEPARRLEVSGLGTLEAAGQLVAREGRMAVVDCGVPLIVAVLGDGEAAEGGSLEEGGFVRFTSVPPVHGFVIQELRRDHRADAGESADDAM